MKPIIEKVKTSNERIKELLSIYGISQTEFCKRTGLTKSAVSNYLNGVRLPRQDQLVKIADAFDVSPAWLMGYDIPRKVTQETVQLRLLDENADIESMEIHGSSERLEVYGALILAADGCNIEQIKPIIEALKAMAKVNKNDTT